MIDPLFSRAQLAIEDSREIQHQSRVVKAQHADMRQMLRCTVFESQMYHSEIAAHRAGWAAHKDGEWTAPRAGRPAQTCALK